MACLVSGGLLVLSSPRHDLWPLTWFGLVPTLWAVTRAPSHRRAFAHGLLTGAMISAGGFPWLLGLLQRFGGLPLAAALPLFLLFCLVQGSLFGFFAWLLRVVVARTRWPLALAVPLVLVPLEMVFPFLLPWYFAIAQAWVLPVIQVAELTGPLGVTCCLAMVNGVIHDLVDARLEARPLPRRPLLAVALTMALVLAFGFTRIHQLDARWAAAPKLRVGVVQPNIRYDLKPQADPGDRAATAAEQQLLAENNRKHQEASARLEAQGAQLIVWPESSYPYELPHLGEPVPNIDVRLRGSFHAPLLFGAVTHDRERKVWFNSAFLLDAKGELSAPYDKIFLLVFGEYIPLADTFPALEDLFPDMGAFARGAGPKTFALADPRAPGGTWKLGPLICDEDILQRFGTDVGRLHPHAFINLTNDAWFGAGSEPWQHLALAVFRTVEHRTGMVRATQTGVSSFLDATGRVRAHLDVRDPPEQGEIPADTLLDEVAMIEGGHTVYAGIGSLWGHADLLGLLLGLALSIVLGGALRDRLRERRALG
jgi:apolipoprotein N-acyltransferase